MTERLSERERIRAILLNKTPLEAADWHLAEVARIVEPLVKFITERPRSLEEQKSYHFFIEMDRAIGETIKRAGGG